MCDNNQTVSGTTTLEDAVILVTKELANKNQPFSAHDITTAIRKKVREGDLEIPEVEVHGSSFNFDIRHDRVKDLFLDAWNNGKFDADFQLTRKFNGTYFEYTPVLNSVAPVTPTSVTPIAPVAYATNRNNIAQDWGATTQTVSLPPLVKADRSIVVKRVNAYLNTCSGDPTLKQIQSGIKRSRSTGWTCAELKDLLEKDLGYSVVVDTTTFVSDLVVKI